MDRCVDQAVEGRRCVVCLHRRSDLVPAPRQVRIDRVLGDPIVLLGYAPETTMADKGVTIREWEITSTRWRDYIYIVQLTRQGIDVDEMLRSARTRAGRGPPRSHPPERWGMTATITESVVSASGCVLRPCLRSRSGSAGF